MYKLLVSDFENTLIDKEEAIPLSTMLSLDKIRTNNIAFSIFTNRSFKQMMDYNKDFPFVDYLIFLDGTYVYDVNKNKALVNKNISISIIKKIKKEFDDYNICFYTLDWCNCTKERIDNDNARKIGDFKVFSDFHKDCIYKIEIRCSSKKEQTSIINKLNELNLKLKCTAKKDNNYYVDIIMEDTGRLDAIEKICNARKATLKDVIMVSSDDNNIDLLKKVGLSIGVSNASSKLKKIVNEVTVDNDSKAVEKVINDYLI